MSIKSERTKEKVELIQQNINSGKYIVDKMNTFRTLQNLGIFTRNTKCGPHYFGYWGHSINGLDWCLKVSSKSGIPNEFYRELLSENIAYDLGFETIRSKIIKVSGDTNIYGIFSQDYRIDGYNVIPGTNIVEQYLNYLEENNYFKKQGIKVEQININSLPFIYDALKFYFESTIIGKTKYSNLEQEKAISSVELIYNKLVLRYVFSYMTLQRDFHLGNWEIQDSEKGVSLSPLYDMELSFNEDFYSSKNTSLKASLDSSLSVDEDFEYFYNESEKNRSIVERMHYLLNPSNFLLYLGNIDMPDDLKHDIYKNYLAQFNKIEGIIKFEDEKKY